MNDLLLSSWDRAWAGLCAQGSGHALRDSLLDCYAESHRRYHTTQHLEECLEAFQSIRVATDFPCEVEIALWFHDAIYALKGSDNEQNSATWAERALLDAGVAPESAKRVHDLVLATRHTTLPVTNDEKALIDVDLAILGAQPDRFAEYERQIRQEYADVPFFLFRFKRRAILASFLERTAIYSTDLMRDRLEVQARTNLAHAIGGRAA